MKIILIAKKLRIVSCIFLKIHLKCKSVNKINENENFFFTLHLKN